MTVNAALHRDPGGLPGGGSAVSVALHHEIAGPPDAPALLLGGSLGTTVDMWRPQLPALAERLRVVRFDHRGHGGSPVPPGPYGIADLAGDVLALLDRLGLERVAYCGLSIGGMVGLWLAAHAPERIDRLVVVSSSAHLPPASAWRERAATVRTAGTVEAVADTVVARWLTPGFARAEPETVEWLRGMLAATPVDGYAACCEALARLDLRGDVPRIAAPTLVVGGAEDPATPPEHARALAAAIPGARLEILSPAAHLASVERAAEVTRLVRERCEAGG